LRLIGTKRPQEAVQAPVGWPYVPPSGPAGQTMGSVPHGGHPSERRAAPGLSEQGGDHGVGERGTSASAGCTARGDHAGAWGGRPLRLRAGARRRSAGSGDEGLAHLSDPQTRINSPEKAIRGAGSPAGGRQPRESALHRPQPGAELAKRCHRWERGLAPTKTTPPASAPGSCAWRQTSSSSGEELAASTPAPPTTAQPTAGHGPAVGETHSSGRR